MSSALLALEVFVRTARASTDTMRIAAWQRLLESLTAGPTHIVEREARNAEFASDGVEYVSETARFDIIPGGHADFQIGDMAVRAGYILKGQENPDQPYFYLCITCRPQADDALPLIFGKILSAIVFADDPKLARTPTTLNDLRLTMPAAWVLQYCVRHRHSFTELRAIAE